MLFRLLVDHSLETLQVTSKVSGVSENPSLCHKQLRTTWNGESGLDAFEVKSNWQYGKEITIAMVFHVCFAL
jgi:hypothetical protein